MREIKPTSWNGMQKSDRNKSGTTEPLPIGQHKTDRQRVKERRKAKARAKREAAAALQAEQWAERAYERETETIGERDVPLPPPPPKRIYSTTLDALAKSNGYGSYADYMGSSRWRAFRESVIEFWGENRCPACRFPGVTLHHLDYQRICNERLCDVVPLCIRCHNAVHRYCKKHKVPLAKIHRALSKVFKWSDAEVNKCLAPLDRARHQQSVDDESAAKYRALSQRLWEDREIIRCALDAGKSIAEMAVACSCEHDDMMRFATLHLAPFDGRPFPYRER